MDFLSMKGISRDKLRIAYAIILIISVALIVYLSVHAGFSGDLFTTAEQATKETQKKLIALAKVLFPLALVILFISILFTRDQRALSTEIKVAVTICIVYALILAVDGKLFNTTVETLTGLGGNGG